MCAWPLRGAAAAAARGGGRAPAEGSGWGAARAGRGARGGQGPWRRRRRLHGARQVVRGPGTQPASALPPGPAGTSSRRRCRRRRGGTARFAEGVKCLKYGGGSESPRTPPPAPARSLPPARGRRSFSRYPPSAGGSPEHSSPAPEPPRWPPRCPPGCGWKLERKPESCPLRRRSFPQPRARTRSVRGKPLPGALQAPA